MILNKLKTCESHNKHMVNKALTLFNLNKRSLFMKPSSGLGEDNLKNKIILNQHHLGLKTTRNDTFLVYQTEESNFFILGKKLLVFVFFISLVELVRRYKKQGTAKYVFYAFFGGLALYSLVHPRFSLSNSIKKIELNKTLDLVPSG